MVVKEWQKTFLGPLKKYLENENVIFLPSL